MEIKCFNVETIEKKDGSKSYKVWFNLSNGIAWLRTDKPIVAGATVKLELIPQWSTDVYQHMKLSLRIV